MAIRLNYQSAALRICLDETKNGAFCGRIVGQRLIEPIFFIDINDFVTQVDALLDVQKFPQAFQRIRSFTAKSLPMVPAVHTKEELGNPDAVEAACGSAATFSLQVFSRKNATWQGSIDWLDGAEKQNFNSILEFIKFIDDRLLQ